MQSFFSAGNASVLAAGAAVAVAVISALRDEPLVASIAGGDRMIGESSALTLRAGKLGVDGAYSCRLSCDPDEPRAQLSFAWACSPAALCPASIASESGPVLALPSAVVASAAF